MSAPTGFEVFERPRAPKGAANNPAAEHLHKIAEALLSAAEQIALISHQIKAPTRDAAGAATSAAEIFDLAVEAVAQHLESGIIHYTWNGNPRRPNNYRAAAADARSTPNPYRKAEP
jgi:hypothetical protein